MLFSTFNFLGDNNPVSKTRIDFSLEFLDHEHQSSTYKLFSTSNARKMVSNITDAEYATMHFAQQAQTREVEADQIQYVIMDSAPTETWIVSDPIKRTITQAFALAAAARTNETVRNDPGFPVAISGKIEYTFTRTQPRNAVTPSGSQVLNFFDAAKDSTDDQQSVLEAFIAALNVTTQDKGSASQTVIDCSKVEDFLPIALGTANTIQPVISLSARPEAALYSDKDDSGLNWAKHLEITYNPCQKYWVLNQVLLPSQPEYEVLLAVSNITDAALAVHTRRAGYMTDFGLSFFVMSARVLPSYLQLPILTFYISIIYVISKLFRNAFVPVSSEIFITDAKDPGDILMLCEVIHLYRLKQMPVEEEELYFLLIDILRSPQVFKAICGESIKSLEKEQQERKNDPKNGDNAGALEK